MTVFGLSEAEVSRAVDSVRAENTDPELVAEVFARVAWGCVTEPGDGVAGEFVRRLGASDALRALIDGSASARLADICDSGAAREQEEGDVLPESLLGVRELLAGLKRWRSKLKVTTVFDALSAAKSVGAHFIVPKDHSWVRALDDLAGHAPVGLWVRGSVDVLQKCGKSVAVVGARDSTGYGEEIAIDAVSELIGYGFVVVSGGAYGIDAAAHRSALTHGGATIAVLAGGVDRLYPRGNESLLTRIISEGAVVSESVCGSIAARWHFLQRNRLIAACTQATIVVEAGWRSGALNTAGHAATLGRSLGAVPGPVNAPASAGCHRLLREYGAVCVTTGGEMAELAGHDFLSKTEDASPEMQGVKLAMSKRSARSVVEIASRSGLDVSTVAGVLGVLDLDGLVRETGGLWLLRGTS